MSPKIWARGLIEPWHGSERRIRLVLSFGMVHVRHLQF